MKLNHLTISNFLGARDVQIDTAARVTLVCGPNGSGKSSVRDALDLALTGALHRVALKKDAGDLVTEGAQKARVSVAGQDLAVEVAISAAGKLARSGASVDALPALLPYVLDGQRFARGLTVDGRRQFLFGLMGVEVNGTAVAKRLQARGCDTKKSAQALRELPEGFPAACNEAKLSATQARGAWKAVTGETYGSQKAEGWRAHEAAMRKTAEAAGHHADVQAWEQIAEALAPSGIPAELLSEALTPLNDALRGHAESAQWPCVAVEADMTVTADGRAYALLSESEQWRADAMLAASIAQLSDVRLLVLDRFDVLDQQGRSDALYWLDDLAQDGVIDTALVFGTLARAPSGLPDNVRAVWIEGGRASAVAAQEQREEVAAGIETRAALR